MGVWGRSLHTGAMPLHPIQSAKFSIEIGYEFDGDLAAKMRNNFYPELLELSL